MLDASRGADEVVSKIVPHTQPDSQPAQRKTHLPYWRPIDRLQYVFEYI
jgi:hypothetical protein